MNKTLYGYTPNENSSLDLDLSDTHIHNIETKRCKVNNDSATYLWHCRWMSKQVSLPVFVRKGCM